MATLLYEATQEDMKFFDLVIANDFREAELVAGDRGFVTESTQEIITEGVVDTLKKAFTKFKEFIKKIIAKIKAIFKSLYVKIEAVFCKDNKKFAEKYEKEVFPKDLTDMKYKWGDSKKFGDILRENTESISLFFKENYSGASIFGNNIVVTPDLKAQRIVLFMTVKFSLPGVEAVTVKKNINIGYLEQEEQFSEPEISFTENLNLRFSSKLLNQVEKSSFDAIVARYQNGNFRECRVFTIHLKKI